MITLGPIAIMSKKRWVSYKTVLNKAYRLHQAVWFDQNHDYSALMPVDTELSEAISHAPPEDIES